MIKITKLQMFRKWGLTQKLPGASQTLQFLYNSYNHVNEKYTTLSRIVLCNQHLLQCSIDRINTLI